MTKKKKMTKKELHAWSEDIKIHKDHEQTKRCIAYSIIQGEPDLFLLPNPIIDKYGTKRWYNENGEYHREDGPAIEWFDDFNEWYINDKRID
jgi:hypothetical protein